MIKDDSSYDCGPRPASQPNRNPLSSMAIHSIFLIFPVRSHNPVITTAGAESTRRTQRQAARPLLGLATASL